MSQGKLEVINQEMARVNIDILGISELKWTGLGKFNSDYRYIYYWGQESPRRNGAALIVNKSLKCNTWMQSPKWQNDLCSFLSKPFNIKWGRARPSPVVVMVSVDITNSWSIFSWEAPAIKLGYSGIYGDVDVLWLFSHLLFQNNEHPSNLSLSLNSKSKTSTFIFCRFW